MKKLRKALAMALSLCLYVLLTIPLSFMPGKIIISFADATNDISVYINDVKVSFPDVKPIIKNGYTLVPVKPISEALGAVITWNQSTGTVTLINRTDKIIMNVGSKTAIKNDMNITIPMAPEIKAGRTLVPLRFICESLGGSVQWITESNSAYISLENSDNKFTALNINGGLTGIFTRKQLHFDGFDGIEADITLPSVLIAEKGDCPYVYFGFDFKNDIGNVESGFQFIEDDKHPHYNEWTVVMHQGKDWRWGNNIYMDQGTQHHLKFYLEEISEEHIDMIIELDGIEIIRKASSVTDFSQASVKTVISMAMSKAFDGSNCFSRSENAKISNVKVSLLESDEYIDFNSFPLYSEFNPALGENGLWFGTADCVPSYLHMGSDGSVSIYKE